MCNCILVLLSLLFPPLPVWIKCGICSAESLINIALCILGYIPGVIHSIYVIAKYPIHYVVLDEEAQVYRRHNQRQRDRVQSGPPRVIIRERVSTPSNELLASDSNGQFYGSTSNENPPDYEQVMQNDNGVNQQYQLKTSRR
ncbi:putative membrane protein [Wickerhamomyces ciferrii]|uniref:Membrane protein n=1 Tax=Wickerhamomyces ciferrii (strain ATCC 14091 / BCRC 22168 / CBS 111 / JCM 3599 / NBRC 0793 / NRRL Y-1031 F-60-10) TaxID=1206466 RepID=K0KQ78_WICCF|nr:uncharacterized protein BN7_2916 [Wickerhamomyces ciferrii]CCH43368.1 putative membrane protein [Wickerhamomyces ciferrii]